MVMKGGFIAWANMGDPNASIPTPEPVMMRPMFGAFGTAGSSTSIAFVSKRAIAGIRRINLDGLRWRVFDAKGQVLGRLASQIATVIQGKDKPTYTPHREDGDVCVVLNAKDVCVTGRKMTDKIYYWRTGTSATLKSPLRDQLAKDPTEVIRKAVLRMLPRNKLRDDRDRKLRIFSGSENPFSDRPLETYEMPPRSVREMRPRAKRAIIRAQKKLEQRTPVTNRRTEYKFDPRKHKKMEYAKRFFGITEP